MSFATLSANEGAMPEPIDIAIIGAGHNGLVAAAYLARKGLKVEVFEARPRVGGAAVTEEFHPGFRNSVCSYLLGMMSPKVIRELDLAAHGLKIVKRPAEGFYPRPDGGHLLYSDDRNAFIRQLDQLREGDGAGFRAFDADLTLIMDSVRALTERIPPNLGGGVMDLARAAGAGLDLRGLPAHAQTVLARLMTQSVAQFLGHYFGHEAVQGAFGYLAAVGTLQSPYAPGSAYVLLHHSYGESNGKQGNWGHAIGGMGAVSEAIASSARAAGARIETSSPVARVLSRNGKAQGLMLADGREIQAKRVLANVNPKLLFQRLVDRAELPADFAHAIDRYRCGSGTFRMNVALAELPDFVALPGRTQAIQHAASIIISPSIDYLERAYDDAKRGGWAERPIIEIWISSTVDPTLAPEGKHVASLFCQHFHPTLSDGRRWEDHRDEVADHVLKAVDLYAPNFSASVIGRQALTPADLEREFGLIGGDIFHGALGIDQIFAMRPVPGFAGYRTPIDQLYLCGAGAHPGGGVTGLPGRNAARAVLADIRAEGLSRRLPWTRRATAPASTSAIPQAAE